MGMTVIEVANLPSAQRLALLKLHRDSGMSLCEFLRRCTGPSTLTPYVSAPLQVDHTMLVGVEPDGYVHS